MLAHLLTLLNERHNYGLCLFLLSIDEGITGTALLRAAEPSLLAVELSHSNTAAMLHHAAIRAALHRKDAVCCNCTEQQVSTEHMLETVLLVLPVSHVVGAYVAYCVAALATDCNTHTTVLNTA